MVRDFGKVLVFRMGRFWGSWYMGCIAFGFTVC